VREGRGGEKRGREVEPENVGWRLQCSKTEQKHL